MTVGRVKLTLSAAGALLCGWCPAFAQISACDAAPGWQAAQSPRLNTAQRELLPGPRIYLESVRRGFFGSNLSACADSGVITVMIDARDVSPTDVYSFELADGAIAQDALPGGFVRPIELDSGETGFQFRWLDLRAGARELEPIDAVVRIRRVSFAGDRSEAMLLAIDSPGGPAAAPTLALRNWMGTVVWIVAAVLLFAFIGRRMRAFRPGARRENQLAAIQARLHTLAQSKREDSPDQEP